MHLTLKRQAARPRASTALQHQAKFDDFSRQSNEERPHEALDTRRPAEAYKLPAQTYPTS